jgi:hypothetical protein
MSNRLDLVSDLNPANYTDSTEKFPVLFDLKKGLPIVVQPAAVMVPGPLVFRPKIPTAIFLKIKFFVCV